jgi:hypothetical protein
MLVDTGTQRSCLDTGVIAKLGMKSGTIAAVMTPYANASTRELPVRTLEIASFHVEDVAMLVIDMSAISAASGFRLDGILGTDILKLLPIQLDFSENLAQPVLLPEASAVSAVVELHEADWLFYRATVIQGVPVRLLLDTGSNLSNISSAAWQRVTAAWEPRSVVRGVRSSGFRSDFVNDKKGQRTGVDTKYTENTLYLSHYVGSTIQVRPEIRFDHSWDRADYDNGSRYSQFFAGLDFIYHF